MLSENDTKMACEELLQHFFLFKNSRIRHLALQLVILSLLLFDMSQ